MSADFITSNWMLNNCTGNSMIDSRKINEKILDVLNIPHAFPWCVTEIEMIVLIDHVVMTDDIGFEDDEEQLRAIESFGKAVFKYLQECKTPHDIEPDGDTE